MEISSVRETCLAELQLGLRLEPEKATDQRLSEPARHDIIGRAQAA